MAKRHFSEEIYSVLSEHFKCSAYWRNSDTQITESDALPSSADLVVVGSGYSGVSAATEAAKAGLSVVVIDSGRIGEGCSSQNGGQVAGPTMSSFLSWQKKFGLSAAKSLALHRYASAEYVRSLIKENHIDCDLNEKGLFIGAHNKRQYKNMVQMKFQQAGIENNTEEADFFKACGLSAELIPPTDSTNELNTRFYHGGCVYHNHFSVHPAKLHLALVQIALNTGVSFLSRCRAVRHEKLSAGYKLVTSLGDIKCQKLVIATNGYTGDFSPQNQRRIIPVGSYMIATEPLAEPDIMALMPNNRHYYDTRSLVTYYRAGPPECTGNSKNAQSKRRILFGGRVALKETNDNVSAKLLYKEMLKIFPQVNGVSVDYAWHGFVGFTFQKIPYIRHENNLVSVMGYCGSGIGLSCYCGSRAGKLIAGTDNKSKADALPYETIPAKTKAFYKGSPWFLNPSIAYYKFRDKLPL